MDSLMSYVMYHIKSDLKGFVCIFVIVDRVTKQLPGTWLIYDCLIALLCVVFIVLIVIFMNYSGL